MTDPIKLANDVANKYYDDERFLNDDCDSLHLSLTQCHSLQNVLRNDLGPDAFASANSQLLSSGFPAKFVKELLGIDGRKIFINRVSRYVSAAQTYCDKTSPQKNDKCDKAHLDILPSFIRSYLHSNDNRYGYRYDLPKMDPTIDALPLSDDVIQKLTAIACSSNYDESLKFDALKILRVTKSSYDKIRDAIWNALQAANHAGLSWQHLLFLGKHKESASDLRTYMKTAKPDEIKFIVYALATHRVLEPSDIKHYIDHYNKPPSDYSNNEFIYDMMNLQDQTRLHDFLDVEDEIVAREGGRLNYSSNFILRIAAVTPEKVFKFLDSHPDRKNTFYKSIEYAEPRASDKSRTAFLNFWLYPDQRYRDSVLSFFNGKIDQYVTAENITQFTSDKNYKLYFPLLCMYHAQSKEIAGDERVVFFNTAFQRIEKWGFPEKETMDLLFWTTNIAPTSRLYIESEVSLLEIFLKTVLEDTTIGLPEKNMHALALHMDSHYDFSKLPELKFIEEDNLGSKENLKNNHFMSPASFFLHYLLYFYSTSKPNPAQIKSLLEKYVAQISHDNLFGAIRSLEAASQLGDRTDDAAIKLQFSAFLAEQYIATSKKFMAAQVKASKGLLTAEEKVTYLAMGTAMVLHRSDTQNYWSSDVIGVFFDRLKKLPKGDAYRTDRITLLIGIGSCITKDHPQFKEMQAYITGPDCAKISPYVDYFIKNSIKDKNDEPLEDDLPDSPTPSTP